MEEVAWTDFERIELRVGTIITAIDLPNAKKPAYLLTVDFGEFGIKKSSAQITKHYAAADLPGRQIVGVINFAKKQIGKIMSEFLVTGFADKNGDVVLTSVERQVPNGQKML